MFLLPWSLLNGSTQNSKTNPLILYSYLINHRVHQCYFLSIIYDYLLLSISTTTTLIQATVASSLDFHNHFQISLPASTHGPLSSIHYIIA